ncbi:MAG TPA: Uma2 family endonuclease [Thermoanaerobaculia bacterium]|nr:Uma2 family endonuclease [Thermoanaerobaculia bacterium]
MSLAARFDPSVPATLRDLDDLPEDVVAHIVDGELIVHPRPEGPHVEAASELGWMLMGPFRHGIGGLGGWVILDEPKILFGQQLLVPDRAGWKKERFVAPRKGPYTVVPDWVCEILSPSTRRFDRSTKLPLFAREGVGHAWVIDPKAQTLEVLRLHEGRWLIVAVHEGRGPVRAEPFDALELDLSLIWGEADREGEDSDPE